MSMASFCNRPASSTSTATPPRETLDTMLPRRPGNNTACANWCRVATAIVHHLHAQRGQTTGAHLLKLRVVLLQRLDGMGLAQRRERREQVGIDSAAAMPLAIAAATGLEPHLLAQRGGRGGAVARHRGELCGSTLFVEPGLVEEAATLL